MIVDEDNAFVCEDMIGIKSSSGRLLTYLESSKNKGRNLKKTRVLCEQEFCVSKSFTQTRVLRR